MNSRKNHVKRVAAGALAVLTVAAYSAPIANVGGLPVANVLVAEAKDAEIKAVTGSAWTKDTLQPGDFFDGNVALHKATENKDTFKIKVDTTTAFTVKKVKDATITNFGEFIADTNLEDVTAITNYVTVAGKVYTFENVTDIEYVAKNTDTTDAKVLKITAKTAENASTVYVVKTEAPDANFVSIANVANVANDDKPTYTSTITLERKANAANGYELDLSEAAAYLEKVVYTFNGTGAVVTNEGTAAKAATTIKAADRTDVTIVSTAILGGGLANYIPVYANGKYTYTFKAVSNKNDDTINDADNDKIIAAKVKAKYTVPAGSDLIPVVKVIKPTDKKETDYTVLTNADPDDGDEVIVAGSTVTVVSDKPFTIANGAIKSQNTDGKFEKQDVVGKYVDGAFKATFVVAGNLDVATTAMPQNLAYTVKDNKITADATVNNEKIVDNAPVASVTATSKVPVYADADKTVIKVENGKPVYTETAIGKNGTISYNKDANAFIELDFDIDPNLIGSGAVTGGGNNLKYKVVATLNGNDSAKKIVYTVTFDGTTKKVTKAVGTGAPENTDEFDAVTIDATGFKYGVQDAGTYKFDLYVWGTDNTEDAKIATQSFTVKPATDVSESDVTLRGFYADSIDQYTDLRTAYVNALKDYKQAATAANKTALTNAQTALEAFLKEKALTVTKNASGIYEVASEAEKLKANATKTVTIIAELADGTSVEISGAKTSGTQETVNNAAIVITDSNYDVPNMAIKWKLVEKAVADAISFDVKNATFVQANGTTEATYANYIANPQTGFIPAKGDNIEAVVRKYLTSTNNIDVTGATFKYTVGTPLGGGVVDIDALQTGLPTFENTDDHKIYYIYATVGSLETAVPLAIVQSTVTANEQIETILTKKTYTYGETITKDDIAFVKAGTDTVIDGLTVKGNLVTYKNVGTITEDTPDEDAVQISYKIRKYKADGTINTNAEILNNVANLVPGNYQVSVCATDKSLDVASGYDVVDKADGENTARVFDITVEKKQLDASMFGQIDVEFNGKLAKLTDADLNDENKFRPTGVNNEHPTVKIAGLDSSATATGDYTVEIGVVDDGANKWTEKYTGTAKVQWRAVKAANALNAYSFTFNDNNTNIYSDKNGIQIHADVQLKKGNANVTADEFKALNVTEYGFVFEKEGKLADLTNADRAKAEKVLQLGISNSRNTIANTKKDITVAGINSKVSSIEDYIWVRPYIKTADGNVKYGNAQRFDFTTVANAVIKPELSKHSLVQKNDSIYYYAYASKVTREEAGYRTATPKAFGVVISRNGNYANNAVAAPSAELPWLSPEAGADSVAKRIVEGTYIDTTGFNPAQLAYYNELKKAYNLTLENADVSSHAYNNKNYTEDECGTLVRITDSLSRVYMRTYVDFGNGLVVYSDLITEENANNQLSNYFGLKTTELFDADANRYYMGASRSKAPGERPAFTTVNTKKGVPQVFQTMKYNEDDVTAFGILIDKNDVVADEKYDKTNFITGKNFLELTAVDPKKPVCNKNELYKGQNKNANYAYGAVTTKGDKTISARAFMVYKGVTIYGNIQNSKDGNDAEQAGV